MDNRTEMFADREAFANLLEAVKWYDAMPTCLDDAVGDRFHEDINDHINESLPTVPELDDDEYYMESTSVVGDTIVINIALSEDGTDSHTITFT